MTLSLLCCLRFVGRESGPADPNSVDRLHRIDQFFRPHILQTGNPSISSIYISNPPPRSVITGVYTTPIYTHFIPYLTPLHILFTCLFQNTRMRVSQPIAVCSLAIGVMAGCNTENNNVFRGGKIDQRCSIIDPSADGKIYRYPWVCGK